MLVSKSCLFYGLRDCIIEALRPWYKEWFMVRWRKEYKSLAQRVMILKAGLHSYWTKMKEWCLKGVWAPVQFLWNSFYRKRLSQQNGDMRKRDLHAFKLHVEQGRLLSPVFCNKFCGFALILLQIFAYIFSIYLCMLCAPIFWRKCFEA